MSEPSPLNFESASNSRYKLLERPVALPGKCVTCGAVDRPVVDTNWNIEFYGVVYFCISCLAEAARVIGMVPMEELRDAEVDSARAFDEELQRRDVKVVSNEQYVYWTNTIANLYHDITRGVHVSDVPAVKDTAHPEFTIIEDIGGVAKQEPKPPVNKRPASVSAGSSDGEPNFNF